MADVGQRERRHGEASRWGRMSDLLTQAQGAPGLTNAEVVAACDALLAGEPDPAWRARWSYTRAIAQMSGDELVAARVSSDALLDEATRSAVPALMTLGHALRSWICSAQGQLDEAVEQVGQAVALGDAADHRVDVEDWSSAFLVIGNAFSGLDLFEHAERWLSEHARLPVDRVSPNDAYAAAWNSCAVAGRLALAAARRPPFGSDHVLFQRVARRGAAVDDLALRHGFEEPGWGALWIAVAEAFIGDPRHALELLQALDDLQDDVSLQRSAGDVWRLARLRAMLRMGRAVEALAWDDMFTDREPSSVPGVVHAEELAWERLMAATADSPAARAATYQYAGVTQRRWVLGSALATDQLVARVAQVAGERERRRLADEAARDPLTNVLNRRGLMPRLEHAAGSPAPAAYGLFVLDVDRFKRVNDSVSHATGDEVLRRIAAVLTASARSRDAVARLGGDEFALLASVGTEAAERLGERLARAVIEATNDAFPVTVSVGVAVRTAPVEAGAWLHAADQAMFEAKRLAPGSVRVTEL